MARRGAGPSPADLPHTAEMAARPGRHRQIPKRRLWPRSAHGRSLLVRAVWLYAAVVEVQLQDQGLRPLQVSVALGALVAWAYVEAGVTTSLVQWALWPMIATSAVLLALASFSQQSITRHAAVLVLLTVMGWWIDEDGRRQLEARDEVRRLTLTRASARFWAAGVAPETLGGVDVGSTERRPAGSPHAPAPAFTSPMAADHSQPHSRPTRRRSLPPEAAAGPHPHRRVRSSQRHATGR